MSDEDAILCVSATLIIVAICESGGGGGNGGVDRVTVDASDFALLDALFLCIIFEDRRGFFLRLFVLVMMVRHDKRHFRLIRQEDVPGEIDFCQSHPWGDLVRLGRD